jgi:hypothetical protein
MTLPTHATDRNAKVEPKLDEHGNIVGIIVGAAGKAAGRSEAKGKSK